MKSTKCFILLFCALSTSCITPGTSTNPPAALSYAKIESLPLATIESEVVQKMGLPTATLDVLEVHARILSYDVTNKKMTMLRYQMEFNTESKVLISKEVHFFDGEEQSNLNFWKKFYPDVAFNITTTTGCGPHSVDAQSYIKLPNGPRLYVHNTKVVRAVWSSEWPQTDVDSRCNSRIKAKK